jgi:hypothetical protein
MKSPAEAGRPTTDEMQASLEVNETRQQVLVRKANFDIVCDLDMIEVIRVEHFICHANNDRALLLAVARNRN